MEPVEKRGFACCHGCRKDGFVCLRGGQRLVKRDWLAGLDWRLS
jgi:hypothetical protein